MSIIKVNSYLFFLKGEFINILGLSLIVQILKTQ